MRWDERQARYALSLFLLIFAAGLSKACLTRPVYPDLERQEDPWPPEGHLVDATILKGRALTAFPRGTNVRQALAELGLVVDPLGSGFCLPRAGVLARGEAGWSIRPMTQTERWAWRIPMDLYRCLPEDLERIDGIGPALARRILRFVQERGSLDSVSRLDEVPGVGKGRMVVLEKELSLY